MRLSSAMEEDMPESIAYGIAFIMITKAAQTMNGQVCARGVKDVNRLRGPVGIIPISRCISKGCEGHKGIVRAKGSPGQEMEEDHLS